MNLSVFAATNALMLSLQALNGASLVLYSGTQPATPETALSGNTALATFTFASPAFSTPVFGSGQNVATASFTSTSATPGNPGAVTFARATINPTGAWAANTSYNLGVIVSQSNNYYVCCKAGTSAASGGPGGQTGSGYSDNTCGWNFIGSSTKPYYADFSVGIGTGSDIILGNLTLSTSVPVTISSFAIQMPAS